MSLPKRSRENCISVLEKWIELIDNTATNGELKLTEKGTFELKNALAWVRGYIDEVDAEPQKVEVDELPTKPQFKIIDGKEYIWFEDEWRLYV